MNFFSGKLFSLVKSFPMVRSVPTLQKHAWKALFMGRCPKPHQGNDSLGTPFACGAGERNTPFTDYLSSAKAKAFANRVKGVTPLQGS